MIKHLTQSQVEITLLHLTLLREEDKNYRPDQLDDTCLCISPINLDQPLEMRKDDDDVVDGTSEREGALVSPGWVIIAKSLPICQGASSGERAIDLQINFQSSPSL